MSNLKSEPLQITTDREKDLLAEIGRLLLQLRAAEIQAHTLQAKLSDLEADGVIDHMGRKLPLPGHHKDCGHGKDGWAMCTCDELRIKVEQDIKNKQFSELVEEGQHLRKEFDHQTAGMRAPPQCSKCGDTRMVQVAPNARGVKQCDCVKGRPTPLAESLTKAFQTAAADAVKATLDRGGTAVGEAQGQWRVVSKTCEHGNTESQKCGVGQPVSSIKTPQGKPLLPAAEFAAMQIEGNKEAGLIECGFQRKSGRTTAMVLKALEFIKQNNSALVVIEVHNPTMKKRIKELLKHYADELGVQYGQLSRVHARDPQACHPSAALIAAAGAVLTLHDNVLDGMKENL